MKSKTLLATTLSLVTGGYCYGQNSNNVLVIVADDLGCEVLSFYNTPSSQKANTPNLNKLVNRGVTFENVWGAPLSAPVRAAMLTGRHGHHNTVLDLNTTLPLSEVTLFEALDKSYANSAIGKWHLSYDNSFASKYGIEYFAGIAQEGGVRNYNWWQFTQNNKTIMTDEYTTTTITNSAKKWIESQTKPWVCWVAYNAPHTPLHLPPSQMHTRSELTGTAEDMAQNPISYYLAMVESLDYNLGLLLESVDESTTIIFIGDNGTEKRLLQPPYSPRHGKGSLYESGIAIPLIIAGKGVTKGGTRSEALVSAVDIFPTVLEFTGKEMASYQDGFSFAATAIGGGTLRKFNFAEIVNPRMGYANAIGDGRYKLLNRKKGGEEFYDTKTDILEQNNLLNKPLTSEQSDALARLRAAYAEMKIDMASMPDSNPNAKGDPARNKMNTSGNSRGGNRSGNYQNTNRNNNSNNSYNNSYNRTR